MTSIILLVISALLYEVYSFEFKDPENGVVRFEGVVNSILQLNMDENNPESTTVVLVTGAIGRPTIRFIAGDMASFNPIVEQQGDDWAVIAQNSIDYEQILVKNFLVQVDDGDDRKMFNLFIVNLDDENPVITNSLCIMKENTTIDVHNSECRFGVADADGWLSGMIFNIINSRDRKEDETFVFEYRPPLPPDNVYEADVYLALQEEVLLDYEQYTLWVFTLKATDAGLNPTKPLEEIQIIVQVEDIPDTPPIWTNIFYMEAFDEESEQTFEVTAIDGDFGINYPINYRLEEPNEFVTIETETGIIHVSPIDRDVGNDKVVFSVTAYEVPDPSWHNTQEITFIINDIDDNAPLISIDGSDDHFINIAIEEHSNDPLDAPIIINDIDLGENAMYTVILRDEEGKDFTSAFQIVPTSGYQKSSFQIAVKNPALIDYETPEWRTITFDVVSIGNLNPSMTDSLPVKIELIDINDNFPIFENDGEFFATVPEDIGIDEFIQTVLATDLDEGDVVTHSILGIMGNRILTIGELDGKVTTKVEDAFDYDKQTEVFVQIQARDLADHVAVASLTITVTDVNNKDPVIRVSSRISIEENQADGTPLDIVITGSDVDTTADLEFSIIWEQSYATKNSIIIKDEDFDRYHCINVETIPDPDTNTLATAQLSIIETVEENTPDYEIFDTLYIYLLLTDKNTVHGVGTDSALVVINIENINDNPPEFNENILKNNITVTENSVVDTTVGIITATDPDGDRVYYHIEGKEEDTADWISIDVDTGTLLVAFDQIDCDDPKRFYIYYTITATDGLFNTTLDIQIYIIDQNDNPPTMDSIMQNIEEKSAGGTEVRTFDAKDMDRDEPYNLVTYSFQNGISSDIISRFRIDADRLLVVDNADLDRDKGPEYYEFQIVCTDNPTNKGPFQHSITVDVRIDLDDINDQIPTIIPDDITTFENLKKGHELEDVITAVDDDSEGPYSQVNFAMLQIQRFAEVAHENEISVPQDLFGIKTDDEYKTKQATLIINDDLDGYHGYYVLTIRTNDFDEPGVEGNVKDDNKVNLEVKKFNFKEPEFIFPAANKRYYLSTAQSLNNRLSYYNNDPFDNLQATDNQDDKYDIKFSIASDSDEELIFAASNADSFGNSQGQLQLVSSRFSENKDYTVTITADVDPGNAAIAGEASHTKSVTVTFSFFNFLSDPVFDYTEITVEFTEEEDGLLEEQTIKPASYSVDIQELPIYYLLREGDASLFNVDKLTGTITLKQKLDYEEETSYELVIQSSNSESLKPDAPDETRIKVHVQVIDINDNIPVFDEENYYGVIMTTYPIGTMIKQVSATDLDVNDVLTYTIDASSIKGSTPSLSSVAEPFTINGLSGELYLNFAVQVNMKGYFTFNVIVADPDPTHTDTTTVRIFVVMEDNRVKFKFENTLNEVQGKMRIIETKLDAEFGYISTLETPTPDTTSSGTAIDTQTIAPAYFIDTDKNEVIEQSSIFTKVSDIQVFTRLRRAFLEDSLSLMSFSSDGNVQDNTEEILRAWLIGVSVVLGALCIILLVAFILKTKSLKQRIGNLTNTKFGSQESNLNRMDLSAPTTNKHAIEGSNPMYKNEVDVKKVDTISVGSGDSDLIGVEDNPEFDYNHYPTKDQPIE